MDLGNYSSQSHVAQQSRRNKLRVQQNTQQIEDYPSNMDQLNSNHAQIPNIGCSNLSYDPSLIPSEMHNFTTNNSQLLSSRMPKDCADQPNPVPWRSCDWVENYLGGDQNVYPIGEGSMCVTKAYDPPSSLYREPSFDLYQGVHGSNFTKISSHNSQKLYEELHYNSLHQNTLPLAEVCPEGLELASIIDQTNINHWSRNLSSTTTSDLITQGLSLSLSPVYPNKTHLSELPYGLAYPEGNSKSNYLNSTTKKTVVTSNSKIFGKTGPLGPFTGYATILNSSRFLGPAQQLLGDMCIVNASIVGCTSETLKTRIFNEANGFGNFANVVDQTRVSSPRYYSSNENSGEVVRTRVVESFRPEYQQRKESLLFMQEEVNRRQKQYHQQMEMVVSSFESVSGLSATTPYISIAVNAISRNFCSLKNVISEQLKNICKALGDASTSSKGDVSSSRLKFIDKERLMKKKIVGGNLGFSEPHGWRPQRGLPERAVAVLRAWLFEHFLHPYPTDTDKHMLASQTGLSRDQVSNWFINARVRLWKPMVEEIHALETNGIEMPNSNPEGINLYATSSSNKVAGRENYGDQLNHNMEKRLRTEYQNPGCTEVDTSFMEFVPNQISGIGINIGGLGPVSLTLGLRQSPEKMGPQQQEQEQQHFGGQMVHHDFVG